MAERVGECTRAQHPASALEECSQLHAEARASPQSIAHLDRITDAIVTEW
jgi:hypothetical protein